MMNRQTPEVRPLYLNGAWVTTPDALDVVNPATGEVFARDIEADPAIPAR